MGWKEREKDYKKQYYLGHKEEICQKKKEYWVENKERLLSNPIRRTSLRRASLKWKKQEKQKWIDFLTSLGFASCRRCGYNKYFEAIHFHHLNSTEKDFGIGNFISGKKMTNERMELVRSELIKGIPLCARCHVEVHIEDGTFYTRKYRR